jgi:hypothetical protein
MNVDDTTLNTISYKIYVTTKFLLKNIQLKKGSIMNYGKKVLTTIKKICSWNFAILQLVMLRKLLLVKGS